MLIQNNPFVSNPEYSNFIALSRYARWLPEQNRRETWEETVLRYVNYWFNKNMIDVSTRDKMYCAIVDLEVMPSMRALMTAGPALDKDNVAGFNCSYLAINRVRAFDELMYILMCGTGVGFSCERQEINQLPTISETMVKTETVIVVRDSKVGWATAFSELISLLYCGKQPNWDVSKVRPAGAPLKTFGGRASGPGPLVELFKYTCSLFKKAVGRKLTSIEVHGLVCKIAEIVVVGGVRRSALISLSNLSDDRMRHAKSGQWWVTNPEFGMANNSVSYTEKPNAETFMREWLALVESKSGERGIFNREAAQKQANKNGRRDASYTFGTNPCSEIILRDAQFCNLSEVVVRSTDTYETLCYKVEIAAILGTLQATLTNFRYLSQQWETNTKEEALLGVSLTGIMDNPLTATNDATLPALLQDLQSVAIKTNAYWAAKLGINQSAAITAVKPSGTVSQLVDSASGIHPRFAPYYIRTVRADVKDPLAKLMQASGFPCKPDVMKPDSTLVFSFPMKAPANAVYTNDRTAIEQLELWLAYQRHWCEHKPSVTVYVKDEEWMDVGSWVYKHFDEVSGVSFLPYSDHTYQQAPYQECTEAEYYAFVASMPKDVDWSLLGKFEKQDHTAGSKALACSGNSCELVDLT